VVLNEGIKTQMQQGRDKVRSTFYSMLWRISYLDGGLAAVLSIRCFAYME
jgi:hypothetical protein